MSRQLNEQKYCGWCGGQVAYKDTWMSECPSCGYRNYINPNPCSNIIIKNNDEVLMVKRAINPHKGSLDFPGGYMEISDKNMESAALRELFEEVGIAEADVSLPKYIGSAKSPEYIWQDTDIKNVAFFYVCELKNPDQIIKPDQTENSDILWVSKEDLPNIDFAWDIDKQMLEKYFGEKS